MNVDPHPVMFTPPITKTTHLQGLYRKSPVNYVNLIAKVSAICDSEKLHILKIY